MFGLEVAGCKTSEDKSENLNQAFVFIRRASLVVGASLFKFLATGMLRRQFL